jgi:hypothetical protein
MRPLTAGIEWQLMCHTAPKCEWAWSSASFTGLLVGLVVLHDALLHLVDGKLARIDALARVEDAPDEADAELGLAAADRRPGHAPSRSEVSMSRIERFGSM